MASSWLTSARLARVADFTHQAFNAVLHASQLGDDSATIEHSRILWKEGHHRKAIQSLEGAIAANVFHSHTHTTVESATASHSEQNQQQQNILTARAHLLLAKWLDTAGQTQSDMIIKRYQMANALHSRWEKGHYYLGKHYNKLLESEKAKPLGKQAFTYVTGEMSKLVIENYLRSLAFGAKYIFQTLPRVLTLWLDLGSEQELAKEPKPSTDEGLRHEVKKQRRTILGFAHEHLKKYISRLPAYIFYTALSQIVARIGHQNQSVYALLADIVIKVVATHPAQALWTLLAVAKSSNKDRATKGNSCLAKVMASIPELQPGNTRYSFSIGLYETTQEGERRSGDAFHDQSRTKAV